MPLPRMRTIKEAVAEFKATDPNTAMNENYLRRMILTKKIPAVVAGSKYLVNMEVLEEILSRPQEDPAKPIEYGTIRKIVG